MNIFEYVLNNKIHNLLVLVDSVFVVSVIDLGLKDFL